MAVTHAPLFNNTECIYGMKFRANFKMQSHFHWSSIPLNRPVCYVTMPQKYHRRFLQSFTFVDFFLFFPSGNGEVDFSEFLDMVVKKMKEIDYDEDMRDAFKTFDRDGNGFIR